MSRSVRVIILNTDPDVGPDLRAVLLANDGVKIVAELDEPALLPQSIDQFPAEVLLVHLDPNPAGMMDVIAPTLEARKGKIAAIGMTEDRNAELVMRAMRAGMKELLWKPFPPEQLSEILDRLMAEHPDKARRIGRVLGVVGAAGGVGATQITTNVSVELAQLERWSGQSGRRPRVVVVDLDFRFGQVAMHLDTQPSFTISELCDSAEAVDPQMLERAMQKHSTGVHVLARPNDFADADRISAGQAASVVAALQEHYDFVVVDVPARFDPTARAVFDMADDLLIVLQLLVPAVRNADRMIQDLARSGYSDERIRLVCNRHGRDGGYLDNDDVESTLRRRFAYFVPDDWKTSAAAVNVGAPLLLHAPKSRLRHAYRQMAEGLAGADESAEEAAAREAERRGLFGFFAGAKS